MIGGVTRRGLSHLSGVPYLQVNRSFDSDFQDNKKASN